MFVDDPDTIEDELTLWCTLHGESMLIAGLYHLIGRFGPPHGGLVPLEPVGLMAGWEVETINPFATLRQALAQEQAWDVHAGDHRAN